MRTPLLNLGVHVRPHAGEIKDPAAAYSGGSDFSFGLQIIESASFDAEEPLDILPPSPLREHARGTPRQHRGRREARSPRFRQFRYYFFQHGPIQPQEAAFAIRRK